MLIISASNGARTGASSRSLVVAGRLAQALGGARVVDLRDYPLRSCELCEGCAADGRCVHDDGFNELAALLAEHDELALVCPHYAGTPSRLMALLEKLEEGIYLRYCKGLPSAAPKRFGVLAHGGMTEGYARLYAQDILVPLRNAALAMGWRPVYGGDEEALSFGVKAYRSEPAPGSVCPAKDDDEAAADAAIAALAAAFAAARGGAAPA